MSSNNVPTQLQSAGALRAWAAEIEQEIAEIAASIVPLQQRLDASREKLDLVRRLIRLSTPPGTASASSAEPSASTRVAAAPQIEDRIEEILRSAGKPVHIRDIRASLIEMGAPLPGRGDEANIILRLRRANDRFVRTERGTYGLVGWNLPEYSPTPRKRTVRRRRRPAS